MTSGDAGPDGARDRPVPAGGADGGALLAIDTATSRVVIGVGTPDGEAVAVRSWPAGHRHGELLLASIERLLEEIGLSPSRLDGIVVGTGPGAFTGLRVGLATAKGLAHGLSRPLAGVATSDALIAAAADGADPDAVVLLLPAGPSDRVAVSRPRGARRLAAGSEPELGRGDVLVAVDLEGRASPDALERGARAHERLGHELMRLGARRIAEGGDDVAALVPEYVTLPRGVTVERGEVAWSRGPR